MAQYRPGQLAELLGVSPDTVRRWCDQGRLETDRSQGGHRMVDGASLARFIHDDQEAYAPEKFLSQSARNRFTGVVTRWSATDSRPSSSCAPDDSGWSRY